jgi:hypothetical protein
MSNHDSNPPAPHLSRTGDYEAIRHLKQAIAGGRHWYPALLQAIGLWETAEETVNERTYRYLIAGEAFDWLLLAERLCEEVDGLFPDAEKRSLLFHGEPPIKLPVEEFKKLIGNAKYHQYLNYFYGITAEEALILAVEEEVRKERRVSGYLKESSDTTNEAYRRIYGTTRAVLLRQFRKKNGYTHLRSISLTELKEFTYWLFKHRLKQCDSARVASDTKKALDWLDNRGFFKRLNKQDFEIEFIDVPPSAPAF